MINRVEAVLPKSAGFTVRSARPEDVDGYIMKMIDDACDYMQKNGIDQWQKGYPSRDMILNDIEHENGYVIETNGHPVAYSAFIYGKDPTYSAIEGNWPDDLPYATSHRTVVAKEYKGMGLVGRFFDFFASDAADKGVSELRCDTHKDNRSMRRALEKNGYTECGIIHLADGSPRIAYYKHI